ncbi:hypothetical protein L3Q82_022646 [Scortum barcoo]|uniref:Uncharacterized protein n=1 Tax=Scortum barcoo TaxID=214431 RepID=A0ACB8X2I3_9TELE|nr:hypothetical protein L3Q82_022646 [Scortum barcoo]
MLACGTPDAVDRYHGRPSKPQPGRSWRQKLGSGRSSVRPWKEDYRSASKRFWQTIRRLRRGKQYSANTVYSAGGELLTSTVDIVGRWKKYFEDLLNPPTDTRHMPSTEEAEAGDSEVDSSITQAEVTEVVRKLLSGKAPEYLKSLDVVGLSWLTRLCNIAWRLGTVPLEWQTTGVVVPLFKKGDRRVCSNYRGITPSQPPREGLRQDDVVLLASSSQDLQHVLERFAAECEAAGMRISTFQIRGHGSRPEKGGMPSSGFCSNMDPDPGLIIVLLGHTGVGKSASGNTILGCKAFESGPFLKSCTKLISEATENVFGKQISVLDTPGILECTEEIKVLCQSGLQASRPVLFLVVLSIGRFTGEQEVALKESISVLGNDGLENSFLLFTNCDALKTMTLDDFIFKDDDCSLPDTVRRFTGKYHLFNNENGGREQVRELLIKSGHLQISGQGSRLRAASSWESVMLEEMRIILLGLPGGGKSASGNTILGSDQFQSHCEFDGVSTETVTKSVDVAGRRVKVVDSGIHR